MFLLDLCSQPYFTCLTSSVYTYLLEFLEVGPWWDKIANFNFITIEPLVITCTAALGALSFPIGTAAIDQQFTLSNGYPLPQSTASRTCNYMRASFVLEWMFQKFKDVIPGSFWEFVLVRWCQESCFECPSPNGCALADRLLSCWNITFTRIACMVLAVWNYFVAREFLVCIWTCRSLILYLRCCVHLFISAFRACIACKTKQMCNQNKSFSWLF